MYELIILITICQEPKGFLIETDTQVLRAPFTYEIIKDIQSKTGESTGFIKMDLTELSGVTCA